VRGASDATYLINAFGEELLMQLQLNVHRLVVVYRVPALDALDASTLAVRLERWRLGAEHAGWKFGWRDAPITGDPGRRFAETYCYAFAGTDFLEDEPQQLYWRTDIVQMTRYNMIEAAHCVAFASRPAGPDSRCKSVPTAAGQNAIGISISRAGRIKRPIAPSRSSIIRISSSVTRSMVVPPGQIFYCFA